MMHKIKKDSAVYSKVDGYDSILLNLDTRRYFRLNETADFMWQQLEALTSPDQIVEDICTIYAVDKDTAARDLNEFTLFLQSEQFFDDKKEGLIASSQKARETKTKGIIRNA